MFDHSCLTPFAATPSNRPRPFTPDGHTAPVPYAPDGSWPVDPDPALAFASPRFLGPAEGPYGLSPYHAGPGYPGGAAGPGPGYAPHAGEGRSGVKRVRLEGMQLREAKECSCVKRRDAAA